MTYGKGVTWTLTVWIRATGEFLPPQLILRGEERDPGVLAFVIRNGMRITTTEKGCQTEVSFQNDMKVLLPLIGATREQPAILQIDGHISRLQRETLRLMAQYNIFCVILPSHCTHYLQTLDNCAMALFQTAYNRFFIFIIYSYFGCFTVWSFT